MARLRVAGNFVWCLVIVPLAYAGILPLRVSRGAFVAVAVGFLVYAILYLVARPWVRMGVRAAARFSTLMDLGSVLFYIVNTNGLTSPMWMGVPLILLAYTMRFGYSATDLVIWAGSFAVMAVVSSAVVPNDAGIATVTLTATLIISGFTIALTQMMVRQEREAYRRALGAENRAMDLMIQTLQHDVNNPLAILSGNIELLEHNSNLPADAPYLLRIRSALRRISHALTRIEDLKHDPALWSNEDIGTYIAGRADLTRSDDFEEPLDE